MPGCLPLIAAILMQKFPGSVKLTCPENQCHIMRRMENWKHEDLAATGYIYNLFHYIWQREPRPLILRPVPLKEATQGPGPFRERLRPLRRRTGRLADKPGTLTEARTSHAEARTSHAISFV